MDIHRCRFVSYNPQEINSLAFSHPPSADLAGRGVSTLRLAIGRANGDIEIWNPLRGAWFQESILRGGKDRSIEGLAWTLDPAEDGPEGSKLPGKLRLFSIGYSSAVTEWDLGKGRPLRHSSGNYGEIWCIAAQPRWQQTKRGKDGKLLPPAEGEFTGQNLAVGCADGAIVVLSTADDDLKFVRLMRPSTKKSRVLSVTFQNRHTIVAGYEDNSIRVYDIRNGQQLRTISLGKGVQGGPKNVLVWSVKCLPDGTIVSADSSGEVKFWDGKNYSLIQRISSHTADALDIAVSADGETVVSGGSDQRTVVYRKTNGEKGDKKGRWAELSHRRYHTHDVKTFAVYETKDISIVVSGGPDATPVVLPLREYGKEHHRKLSSLPQIPQLSSSPASRLVMSFWDNEVSLWRVLRGPTSPHESLEGQRHKLVAKVLIQGEETISSASLSSDGKILAVSTISDVKLFAVRRRKGDEKVKALALLPFPRLPMAFCDPPHNDVYMSRIQISTNDENPELLPQLAQLKRIPRQFRREKASHGTLGDYERVIRSVVFSEDSKLLAAGDLSGCVDTWVLSSATEAANDQTESNGAISDDEPSDDEDEDESVAIEGERWKVLDSESAIPRMKTGITLLSFRPNAPSRTLTNGAKYTSSTADDRLMRKTIGLVTTQPQSLPASRVSGVRDRAMGCIWDISETRERLWLYGTSWLWMFDLQQDFSNPEEIEADAKNSLQLAKASKRKRDPFDEDFNERKDSGAGDRIPRSQMDIHLGSKVRKIDDEDYEYDEDFAAGNETTLARLRRGVESAEDAEMKDTATTSTNQVVGANGTSSQPVRRWWHTYKYRDILGIVPLNVQRPSGDQTESGNLEVAVVERPMWEVDLPEKYAKQYE
ncbi:hypothetical protein N7468_004064 [Penicillium chermesinum]|uniref:Uncharacterized protein n=1 Tax=Penicillium chermesinum TaxID=63820 RepID=A0A9W9P831_9EURO|nr:uncharacterized protein N7468_004064 [Penicillium chermesinum]KAJ5239445.1 hypothetical protein N7468_004064 [Penicillium chermesinum]